ncbi:MFS transporter [Paracoccus pacificus]|uniref:MFS transporter n=1 Tax=Paracoccus pacificus TaxID=1463598 RepID=A0ABW4R5L2_9RHOB
MSATAINPPRTGINWSIMALMLGAFAIGTSEFAAMGLLPWFAADFGATDAQAGHVISAYALGVVFGAPVMAVLGARLPRRRYLAMLIGAYGVLNLIAAFAPGLATLTLFRFLAGVPHGAFLGVSMVFAAEQLPREHRARGAAQVLLGLTIANIAGVPLAGALGQGLGWRWGFALPGVIGLMSAALILQVGARGHSNPNARPLDELRALRNPAVLLVLLFGAVGCGGLFAVYSYMSAAILATTQGPGWVVPGALSLFGIGMTISNIVAGRLTDRSIWGTALGFVLFMIFGQIFAAFAVGSWPLMMIASLLIGLGCGVVIPLQTRLMDVADKAQNMAAAMNHAAFNAANALGPWLAGMALAAGYGWRAPAWVAVGVTLVGLLLLGLCWAQSRRR